MGIESFIWDVTRTLNRCDYRITILLSSERLLLKLVHFLVQPPNHSKIINRVLFPVQASVENMLQPCSNGLVLIKQGAGWCSDCRILNGGLDGLHGSAHSIEKALDQRTVVSAVGLARHTVTKYPHSNTVSYLSESGVVPVL